MQKNFPGKHATLLYLVALLLLPAFIFDQVANSSELIDTVYVIPIVAAAILLSPLETLATGLLATILELISENPSLQTPTQDLWTCAAIAAFGAAMATGSYFHRQRMSALKTARTALELSPVAYAEFKYPSCALLHHNDAFLKMASNRTGDNMLFDLFPEATAGKLADLLTRAASMGRLSESMQLSVAGEDGRSTFWSIDFIPTTRAGKGTPQSVVMLAYEETEAVLRTRVRDAAIEIATEVMSSLDLDRILRVALDRLAYITEVNAGGICLIEDGLWVGKAGFGEYSDEMVCEMRIPYREFHSGAIASESRKTLVSEDAANDLRCNPKLIDQLRVKSALVVPLVSGHKTIGVAWLTQTNRTRNFTEEQVKFCTVIGSQVAAAISNAISFENECNKARELAWIEPLREVTAACASSSDLESICQQTLEAISRQFDCKTATVFCYERESDSLVTLASIGHPPEVASDLKTISMDRDSLVVVQAVKKQVMVIQDGESAKDMSEDQRHLLETLGVLRSRRIYMPLIVKQEAVGCLCFAFPLDRTFSTIGLDILNTIGNQLALAIHNWELSGQAV
jgi:GAF domain-containing protein